MSIHDHLRVLAHARAGDNSRYASANLHDNADIEKEKLRKIVEKNFQSWFKLQNSFELKSGWPLNVLFKIP